MSSTSNPGGHSMWHKAMEHIPQFLKFNPRIVRGYRVNYNLRSLMRSLFEWHNETVNTWTHLVGTVIIFAVILSSNLFTQHYHSQHQLLHFRENLQTYRAHIDLGFQNITSSEFSLSGQIDGIFGNLTGSIKKVEEEMDVLLRLTEQDNITYREGIYNYSILLQITRDELQKIIVGFSIRKEAAFLENSVQELRSKIKELQDRLNFYILEMVRLIQSLTKSINPIPKWPLLVFLSSASLCLTFSFTFHLFHPHSERLYRILRKLDFSGVILLIVGSSFPLFVYGASCVNNLSMAYLTVMSIVGLAVFGLLVSGYFDPKERQKKKSWLFGLFGVSFVIPLCHLLILQQMGITRDTLGFSQFAIRVLVFGAIYLIGLFIYTVQCPERFVAGRFDYCGASHQIWHLLVLLALFITYELNWDLYYERRIHPCPS